MTSNLASSRLNLCSVLCSSFVILDLISSKSSSIASNAELMRPLGSTSSSMVFSLCSRLISFRECSLILLFCSCSLIAILLLGFTQHSLLIGSRWGCFNFIPQAQFLVVIWSSTLPVLLGGKTQTLKAIAFPQMQVILLDFQYEAKARGRNPIVYHAICSRKN